MPHVLGKRPRKLLLKSDLSPGDIVMLTAAVRDLHCCHPGEYLTDVRTSCPELWLHNPHLTPLDACDPEVEVIACDYPLIDESNEVPYHCLHGFARFLSDHLGREIRLTGFKGDIQLSAQEKSWMSQVHELTGEDTPFWIIAAGGKYDLTIKWWETSRFQKVVDHFRGRIQFVQIGEHGHHHPRLDGVIDLRGRTDLRELVRLVHHAQGVLCPVTAVMHLAAAVETKRSQPPNRPCVVIAGGREPVHWEAYPHHQFIHTVGALRCCEQGGCWRSRTRPIGGERDEERDQAGNLCLDVVKSLPRCMDMITPAEVIRRIETYFHGGALRYMTPAQARVARRVAERAEPNPFDECLTPVTARAAAERYIKTIPPYPETFSGRGIVICAGGLSYFANAWVSIRRLRQLGCTLPIQLWHLGEEECNARMRALVAPFGVECVDAHVIRRDHPARRLLGWELKPYAILHCPFRDVLLLDADNVAVRDPSFLFTSPEYQKTGALFWPDFTRLAPTRSIWKLCGVAYRDEPDFESGQLAVDKRRCWRALNLTMWYNEHSDLFYRHIHGDKDTFHFAFRKLDQPYAMPSRPAQQLPISHRQFDFEGRLLFQHRGLAKWELFGPNRPVKGFRHERECLAALAELREQWEGTPDMPTIIIQQASGLHTRLLDLTAARHQAYADKWGFTFWSVRGGVQRGRSPLWNKISLIRAALELPFELVVWLDADTLLWDLEADLRKALKPGPPIGMCRHPVGCDPGAEWHFNAGIIFVRNTPLSRRFFARVPRCGTVTHPWQEQTRINRLVSAFPRAIQTLEARWNCTRGVNPSPAPVILAWHGCGPAAHDLMRATLEEAAAADKARLAGR